MSGTARILRGSARAATGIVVVAAAATAVLLVTSTELPALERTPPSFEVDTLQNSQQQLVCAGSFSVLGIDPGRPEAAIPVGSAALTVSGEATEVASLSRPEGGDAPPSVVKAPSGAVLGAAQFQSVSQGTARGAAASSCAAPLNEQWLLGGDTTSGVSMTLSLGNPGSVPATAQVAVYDENGRVAASKTASVLVPAGAEQTVSLNGYAPDRGSIAVRVVSTGAPVTASLGVVQSLAIDPFAADTVTRQEAPTERLVVPGVTNLDREHGRGPGDVGGTDAYKVRVRVLAPDDALGTARISALDAKGNTIDLGEIPLVGEHVGQLEIEQWPAEANAVIIDADVPVIGGVMGSINDEDGHDFAWFAPAPELPADTVVPAPVVDDGSLVIANTGDEAATVEIAPAGDGKPKTVQVEAGAAVAVDAPAGATLTSSAPVHAGVRYLEGIDIAGYPLLGPSQRDGALTVYPR